MRRRPELVWRRPVGTRYEIDFLLVTFKSYECVLSKVEVGGTYMVRRGEGTWCHAEIIQKRLTDSGKEYEYYVHYENHNRRLDEWVLRDRVMVSYDGLEVM